MCIDILRGERLRKPGRKIAEYTSSIQSDKRIIREVVKINMAHTVMLAKTGLLEQRTAKALLRALTKIPLEMNLDAELEDVHMNIEKLVIEQAGIKAGGMLHLAKSRNDQVATAIRMGLRRDILRILGDLIDLLDALLSKAAEHVESIMAGYTHLQHAQPITLSHYLLAHFDALLRDFYRLVSAYERVNMSPMGAAALASTGFQIDRHYTARLLGFSGLIENSIDAVSSRDFALEVLSDLSILMTNLSSIAEELILWSTSEFGFVEISDEFASASSIMPQKKNPVVAEIIRARAARVVGDLSAALTMLKAMPYSYNLDLQELTPLLWDACDVTASSLEALAAMLPGVRFDVKKMKQNVLGDLSTATDLANLLVKKGMSFREAHALVGKAVKHALEKGTEPERALKFVAESGGEQSSIIAKLSHKEISDTLDPVKSVEAHDAVGGPSPQEVKRMMANRRLILKESKRLTYSIASQLKRADERLQEAVGQLEGGDIS